MICPKVPERLSSITIRIAMRPGKCHDELLEAHTFLALKYSYSDEVFLLPARRISIRIALDKKSSLKTPD